MPKSASVTYRIGEVAMMATVSVAAVRYYERVGLLPHPPRTESGRRRFTAAAVDRIRFVKQAQRNGLALSDIRELVGLQSARTGNRCRQVHQLLERKLAEIDKRRAELDAFRTTLQTFAHECAQSLRRGPDPDCPVIDEIATGRGVQARRR
jgi:DNA-binding transcriptional MerR regulator